MSENTVPFRSQAKEEIQRMVWMRAVEIMLGPEVGLTSNGCWLWMGTVAHQTGYGFISFHFSDRLRPHLFTIHKLSYEYFKGQRTRGLVIRHTCDVRRCFNPEHLLEGTRKENTADMIERGRAAWQSGRKSEPEVISLFHLPKQTFAELQISEPRTCWDPPPKGKITKPRAERSWYRPDDDVYT